MKGILFEENTVSLGFFSHKSKMAVGGFAAETDLTMGSCSWEFGMLLLINIAAMNSERERPILNSVCW